MFKEPKLLDPAIRAHLEAENAYVEAAMLPTKALRERLVSEMRGRIKEDDSSVPMPDGPYAYGSEFVTGAQHPRTFRQPREGGERTVLLDADAEAEKRRVDDESYFRPTGLGVSPDHALGLWGYDDQGSEYFTLAVRDLDTATDRDERLTETGGGGAWDANSAGFFYTLLDDNHRPSKVLYHRLGTDQSADRLVRHEEDAGFFMGVGGSIDDSVILIDVHDHETSEIRILPADRPDAEPTLVAPRETGHEYDVEPAGGTLYIRTNDGGASPDFRIVTAPVDAPGRENWAELVPHEPGRLILTLATYKRHLVRLERVDALPRIIVRDLMSGDEHAIAFDEEAYSLGLIGAAEYDTDVIRFSYSSMTTPARQYEYDMATRERRLIKEQEVPSGHDPADYVTRRLHIEAEDGERVPVSILHRADTALDGSAPCLLYGYGSYGITIPAAFNTNCLSLVDRGFVYAIAHVRGGKDRGQAWYEAGKRERKQKHVPRLRRRRARPRRRGLHERRAPRRAGRLGGRHADGRGAQHGARRLRRHHRRGAVRGRADDHARRHAAPHPARMARMGQPDRVQGGLRSHRRLFPLRQRRRAVLPTHPRGGGPDGPPRDLLGARQMGRPPARAPDGGRPDLPAHQHGRRPRRQGRSLRAARRGGVKLCVRAGLRGAGGGGVAAQVLGGRPTVTPS